ncbi:hypothetical protein F4861DRAFT_537332 [Xylaria intraflava]|nr:hypothetical protein F4861DRAFT_537332 [Xylaria intraflava]
MASATTLTATKRYVPECAHGSILVTIRDKQAGLELAKESALIKIYNMTDDESQQPLRPNPREHIATSNKASTDLSALSSRLEYLPLALVQTATFMREHTITVNAYLKLLDQSDQILIALLSEELGTVGRDSRLSHVIVAT